MKRIAVIGCSGSGKTYLAKKLSEVLDLPLVHLDQIYWNPGWVPSTEEEFARTQREIVEEPSWIIDGNYNASIDIRIEAADTIIWFDFPTHRCLIGTLARIIFSDSAFALPEGCEPKVSLKLLWYIINFRRTRRPRIAEKLSHHANSKRVDVIRTRNEADAFIEACT